MSNLNRKEIIPDWEPFTIIERSSRGSFFFAAHSPDAPEEFDENDDPIRVKVEFDKLPEALEAVGFKILRIGSEYAYEIGNLNHGKPLFAFGSLFPVVR